MENISVKLQHDECNSWGVKLCSQGNLTVSKFEVENITHKGQYRTRSIFWCEEHPYKVTASYQQYLRSFRVHKAAWLWASLKVQKGHTKTSSKILMWKTLLSSYNLIQAIYEELSHSQGPSRCCPLESLKRWHKSQHQICWNSDEESITQSNATTWCRQMLRLKNMKIKPDSKCTYCNNTDSITHFLIDCKSNKLFSKCWAKWWQSMTGLNIRDESHMHESILFGFPGRSDDAIVINYCKLYAKH